jgi:hypothetical protein
MYISSCRNIHTKRQEKYKLFFQNGTAFLMPFHFLQHYNGKANLSDSGHIILILVYL